MDKCLFVFFNTLVLNFWGHTFLFKIVQYFQNFQVNDESVQKMPTADIIDLLRIVRGSINVTVLRFDQSVSDETN